MSLLILAKESTQLRRAYIGHHQRVRLLDSSTNLDSDVILGFHEKKKLHNN